MFSFNDMYDTDQGSYMVNGRGVDTYYYANHLFLDINQFCNASGLTYHFVNNGAAMVFLSTSQQLAAQPGSAASPVRVVINGATTGSNPDPINNCSYIYTVGLTNTTGTMITVNHFNFLVIGASGARYTSVKNMGYVVVFGDNDTPDVLSLDPGQGHSVTLTFDLPENDTPRRLVILQGQSVLGSAEVKDGY
jgi:hypothetical protein